MLITPFVPLDNCYSTCVGVTAAIRLQNPLPRYLLSGSNLSVSKKPTKNEKLIRVDTVYGMLCDGKSRTDVLRNCAELWDVGERTADNYIAEARVKLEQDCKITREAFMAEALAGYRSIRAKAESRGQLMVSKASLDAMCNLVGLTDK